jgi:DNA-3-methyladenine glycosylase I
MKRVIRAGRCAAGCGRLVRTLSHLEDHDLQPERCGGLEAPVPDGYPSRMSSYCEFAPGQPFHGDYHDHEYGFPIDDDDLLFERFMLEINQAGLSWLTILKKKDAFRRAFDGFDLGKVAAYGDQDRERLLGDASIIRNRLKVNAAIENARRILELKKSHGSFKRWLDAHHPRSREEWQKLFKKTFVFTGGEIVNEFLLSSGYLPGAHREECPVYKKVLKSKPPWNRNR